MITNILFKCAKGSKILDYSLLKVFMWLTFIFILQLVHPLQNIKQKLAIMHNGKEMFYSLLL